MSKSYIVDSIHSGVARLEDPDGRFLEVPSVQLPRGARDGHVVTPVAGGDTESDLVRFAIDRAATEQRKKVIRAKLDTLRGRSTP